MPYFILYYLHLKQTISSLLFLLGFLFAFSGEGFSKDLPFSALEDTTEMAKKLRLKLPPKDSTGLMSDVLLASHPMFTDHWINDEAFVYEEVTYEDIQEEVFIPLLEGGSNFKVTWYGKVNSTYKKRWGRYHQGVDLQLHTGDQVFAAFDGIVRYAQYNRSGYGYCVIIRHLNGLETIYGHLSKIMVKPNEFVTAGTSIGLGGSTGHSFGPHLHFETRYKDFSFDPELVFNFEQQELKTENLILEKKQFLAYHNNKYRRNYKNRKAQEAGLPAVADSTEKPIDLIDAVSADDSGESIESAPSIPNPSTSAAANTTFTTKTVTKAKNRTSTKGKVKTVAAGKKGKPGKKSTAKKKTTAKKATSKKNTGGKNKKATGKKATKNKPGAKSNKKVAVKTTSKAKGKKKR